MKYEGDKWTFSKFIAYEISSGIEGNLIFVVYPLKNERDNVIWQGCWPPRFLSSSIFFSISLFMAFFIVIAQLYKMLPKKNKSFRFLPIMTGRKILLYIQQ